MAKFKESLFRAPKAQLSYLQPEPAKRTRAKVETPPRSMDIGPYTVLTIFPDQTAGGQKLIQLPAEAMERFAREELQMYRQKVAFLEEWLCLPKREYTPYI